MSTEHVIKSSYQRSPAVVFIFMGVGLATTIGFIYSPLGIAVAMAVCLVLSGANAIYASEKHRQIREMYLEMALVNDRLDEQTTTISKVEKRLVSTLRQAAS
jgi:hypothetical protein